MRTRVFRVLAGGLAILVGWFLTTADLSARPIREVVGFWAIGVVFGAFALFGAEPAERLLVWLFGGEYPVRPPARRPSGGDKHTEPRS